MGAAPRAVSFFRRLSTRLRPEVRLLSPLASAHFAGWSHGRGLAFNPKRPAYDDDADGLLQKSKVIDTVAGMKERRC